MKRLWAFALAVLLSGCLVEEDPDGSEGTGTPSPSDGPGGPGQGFAPQQGTAHGSSNGIDVDVVWRACDEGFCAAATATNNGSETVKISSICEPPWTDRMSRDGEPVAHREGQAMCLAYGRADFGPGDSRQADFTWDGRVHQDGGTSTPAPEGAYTWTIAFWWDDADGGARKEATADIQIIIGET
jgi:hypothetical protein